MNDETGYEGTLGYANAVMDQSTGSVSSEHKLLAHALDDLGLDCPGDDSKLKVKTFLNRLLGLRVDSQNAIFDMFQQRLADCVSTAKETGQFDEGVSNLRGQSFQLKSSEALSTDQVMGATTVLHDIVSDRGVSWTQALVLCCDALTKKEKRRAAATAAAASQSLKPAAEAVASAVTSTTIEDSADAMESEDNLVDSDSEDDDDSEEEDDDDEEEAEVKSGVALGNKHRDFGFFESKGSSFGRGITYLWAKQKNAHLWVVTRPNSGRSQYEMETDKLNAAYRRVPVSLEEAKAELAKAELATEDAKSQADATMVSDKVGVVVAATAGKGTEGEDKINSTAAATVDERSSDNEQAEEGVEGVEVAGDENRALARLRKGWCATYEAALSPDYKHGQRICKVALLGGAILPVWAITEQVVAQHGRDLALAERALRVVRVTTDCGKSLAGVKFPANLVPFLKEAIKAAAAAKATVRHAAANYHASSAAIAGVAGGGAGGGASAGESAPKNGYIVQPPTPIDPKALKFASTPAPTIMSFFGKPAQSKSSDAPSSKEAAVPSLSSPLALAPSNNEGLASGTKRAASEVAVARSGTALPRKKQLQHNTMMSMFKPKGIIPSAPMDKVAASDTSIDAMSVLSGEAQEVTETIDLT